MKPKFCLLIIIPLLLADCSGNKMIKGKVDILNRHLPQIVIDGLRIDSVVFNVADHSLGYYYSVLSESMREKILSKNIDSVKQDMAKEIRYTKELEFFRSRNLSFEYIYISKENKKTLARIAVEPSDYQ